jgi:hypothetical protein
MASQQQQQQQQPMDVDAGAATTVAAATQATPQRPHQPTNPPAPTTTAAPDSEHYRRLQALESAVIAAVAEASGVMAEMSLAAGADLAALRTKGASFLDHVSEAQRLLLVAVRAAAADRGLEASAYQPMVKAMVAGEKVEALLAHLRGIEARLLLAEGDEAGAGRAS